MSTKAQCQRAAIAIVNCLQRRHHLEQVSQTEYDVLAGLIHKECLLDARDALISACKDLILGDYINSPEETEHLQEAINEVLSLQEQPDTGQ